MCGDIFLGFFNKRFHCVIVPKKRSLEHPKCCIRCTSACGRFRARVWLHFTSRDDCLQTVRTLDTGRRLPLVAICATWRADQVLYGSCTIGIYNNDAVLCVFTQDYRSWKRSEIEEFHVVQRRHGSIELCVLL